MNTPRNQTADIPTLTKLQRHHRGSPDPTGLSTIYHSAEATCSRDNPFIQKYNIQTLIRPLKCHAAGAHGLVPTTESSEHGAHQAIYGSIRTPRMHCARWVRYGSACEMLLSVGARLWSSELNAASNFLRQRLT
jgi:hypothetical protein